MGAVGKKFIDWIQLKYKLHSKQHRAPYVSEGDIWWASLGENIGYEINGKSERFTRPVIIFKKLSRSYYCVIPTTTQKKSGTWFAAFSQKNRECSACLHQIRTIDHRRLWSKLGELDTDDFSHIKEAFNNLYK